MTNTISLYSDEKKLYEISNAYLSFINTATSQVYNFILNLSTTTLNLNPNLPIGNYQIVLVANGQIQDVKSFNISKMRSFILSVSLLISLTILAQSPNPGTIIKTIPDSAYINDTLNFITSFTFSPTDFTPKCLPTNNIVTQHIGDTLKIIFEFDYPLIQVSFPCQRFDTVGILINGNIGPRIVLVDWQVRDTSRNLPFTSFDIDTLAIQVYGSTHLKERAFASLGLFPNPVKDRLNLNGLKGKSGQIRILDLKGRLVKSTTIQESIDLSDLEAGVYLIKIIDEQKVRSQKIVKE